MAGLFFWYYIVSLVWSLLITASFTGISYYSHPANSCHYKVKYRKPYNANRPKSFTYSHPLHKAYNEISCDDKG